jgi:hypothetical protein
MKTSLFLLFGDVIGESELVFERVGHALTHATERAGTAEIRRRCRYK